MPQWPSQGDQSVMARSREMCWFAEFVLPSHAHKTPAQARVLLIFSQRTSPLVAFEALEPRKHPVSTRRRLERACARPATESRAKAFGPRSSEGPRRSTRLANESGCSRLQSGSTVAGGAVESRKPGQPKTPEGSVTTYPLPLNPPCGSCARRSCTRPRPALPPPKLGRSASTTAPEP